AVGPTGGADPLAPYDAVLVLSYGGPAGPADVLPFMRNATAGRGVPDSRLLEVSGHYAGFDGVSPINARNAELLDALRAELVRRGSSAPVVIGNRNWHPFVTEAMRELADGGARRLLSLTTAAYASYSGCRQYREDTAAALARLAAGADGATGEGFEADAAARVGGPGGGPVELVVDKTRPFYNTPGMLEANADAIADAWAELVRAGVPPEGIRLVLVTHSIPVGMERGSAPRAGDGAQLELRVSHSGVSAPRAGDGAPGDAGDAVGTAAAGSGSAGAGSGSAAGAPTGGRDLLEPGAAPLEPGMAADLSTEISYVDQHRRFIEVLLPAVARRLGTAAAPAHDLVFCSRSGPPQAQWLEPDVNDHLEALAAGRLTDGTAVAVPDGVVVAPIGFVADHMEVVFDLDTEARATAERLAMPCVRAATAGTHPAFIASLADVLLERAAVARGEEVAPASTTGTGPFHTVCPESCCRPAASGRSAHPRRTR
uniref:ferrochelatase n=1 Tax=Actinomyces dentalis TaxID=272548 RepID=UPI0028E6742E